MTDNPGCHGRLVSGCRNPSGSRSSWRFLARGGHSGHWANVRGAAPRYVALALAAVFKDIPPWTPPRRLSFCSMRKTSQSIF